MVQAPDRYLHVEPGRRNDAAVRQAWLRRGLHAGTPARDKAFLFESPDTPDTKAPGGRKATSAQWRSSRA